MKYGPSQEAISYVQYEMNQGGLFIRIAQIMPSIPNTYALYKESGAPTKETGEGAHRMPVVAWGIWDAYLEGDKNKKENWVRKSGPLVYELGHLWPAEVVFSDQYIGIRIGNWESIDGGQERWLDEVKETNDGVLQASAG